MSAPFGRPGALWARLRRVFGGRPKTGAAGAAAVLAAAAAFVGPWEGRELRAYRDIAGVWTICFGHTAGAGPGQVATAAECDGLLAADLAAFHARLAACLPGLAGQPQAVQVALLSWSYNVGTAAACGSTLVRLAGAGDWRRACNELPRWVRAGGRVVRGLERRRAAERALCLSAL